MIFTYKHHQIPYANFYHATPKFLSLFTFYYFFSFSSSRLSLVNAQIITTKGGTDWNLDPVYTSVTVTIFTFLFIVCYVIFYYCFHHFLRSPRAGLGRRARRLAEEPARGGLDPPVLKTFPVFTYSEVSGLGPDRPGKGPLECAVCLSPFEADETLRLLPKCDHVFHLDCVDRWLAGHVTCPLCRANLEPQPDDVSNSVEPAQVDELGIRYLNEVLYDVVEERREIQLEGQNGKLRRWYSTGHVACSVWLEDRERFTLRLPDDVRNEFLRNKLNRSRSCILSIKVES